MRKLLDLNAWLALFLEGHSQHAIARRWYEVETVAPADLSFEDEATAMAFSDAWGRQGKTG